MRGLGVILSTNYSFVCARRSLQSQAPASTSSFSAAGVDQQSAELSAPPPSYTPTATRDSTEGSKSRPPKQGVFSWAYAVVSPTLVAVATMASDTVSRNIPSRPLPQPPVNLYNERTQSTGSTSSRDSSISGNNVDNILGIIGAAAASAAKNSNSPSTEKTELDQLTSRLNRAAHSTGIDSPGGGRSLRSRKISLYEDGFSEDDASPATTRQHTAENSWSG